MKRLRHFVKNQQMTDTLQTLFQPTNAFYKSHLQVGELLLLMGNGLLHQHTLNALFHGILLRLKREKSHYKQKRQNMYLLITKTDKHCISTFTD